MDPAKRNKKGNLIETKAFDRGGGGRRTWADHTGPHHQVVNRMDSVKGTSSVSPAARLQTGGAKAGKRKETSLKPKLLTGGAAADGPGRTTPDHTIKW
jgi:hypothetical protein